MKIETVNCSYIIKLYSITGGQEQTGNPSPSADLRPCPGPLLSVAVIDSLAETMRETLRWVLPGMFQEQAKSLPLPRPLGSLTPHNAHDSQKLRDLTQGHYSNSR